jgi:hypothetical protein
MRRRAALDTCGLTEAGRWETLIEQVLAFPPPYRAAPGSPVYVIHAGDRAVLAGEQDLTGPVRDLVMTILAAGGPHSGAAGPRAGSAQHAARPGFWPGRPRTLAAPRHRNVRGVVRQACAVALPVSRPGPGAALRRFRAVAGPRPGDLPLTLATGSRSQPGPLPRGRWKAPATGTSSSRAWRWERPDTPLADGSGDSMVAAP